MDPSPFRLIMGLTGLARKHGAALTDDACAAALEVGLPANPYGFVRRWPSRSAGSPQDIVNTEPREHGTIAITEQWVTDKGLAGASRQKFTKHFAGLRP